MTSRLREKSRPRASHLKSVGIANIPVAGFGLMTQKLLVMHRPRQGVIAGLISACYFVDRALRC